MGTIDWFSETDPQRQGLRLILAETDIVILLFKTIARSNFHPDRECWVCYLVCHFLRQDMNSRMSEWTQVLALRQGMFRLQPLVGYSRTRVFFPRE